MSIRVQEPNEIETTPNPNTSYILVYVNDGTNNGLRRLKLSDWKGYLNFNGQQVITLGQLTGFTKGEISGEVPEGNVSLKTKIENIKDNLIGSGDYSYDEVLNIPVITTLTNIKNDIGIKTETEGDNSIHKNIQNLLGDVEDLYGRIGSGSGSSSLSNRITNLENDTQTIQGKVNDIESDIGTRDEVEGTTPIHTNIASLLTNVGTIGGIASQNESDIRDIITKLNDTYCVYKGTISELPSSDVEKGWVYKLTSNNNIKGTVVYTGGIVIANTVSNGTITWEVLYNPVPVFNRSTSGFTTNNLDSGYFYLLICADLTSAKPSKTFVYNNNTIYDTEENINAYFTKAIDSSTGGAYYTPSSNISVIYHKIG